MKIHGKELYQTEDGSAIYYDHILISSKSRKLNEYNDFEYWVKLITANPNFNPRKYHPNLL